MTDRFDTAPAAAPTLEQRPAMVTAATLSRLDRFRGGDAPVVSAYVGVPLATAGPPAQRAGLSHTSSLLREVKPLVEEGALDRSARLSVRDDIARIEQAAAEMQWSPGSVAFFACSAHGLFETVALPRTVRDRVVVDPAPWTRPMHAVLDEYHRAAVVVLDRRRARLWEVFHQDIREEVAFQAEVVRKPNFGGWYGLEEHRVSDRAEEVARRHFARVVDTLRAVFRHGGYELLLVGGHQDELQVFTQFLPKELQKRVAGTFTADVGTATDAVVRAAATELIDRYERDQERRAVAELLDREASRGLATSGLQACLWAGSVSAVQQLLVDDEAVAPGRSCEACGWLGVSGDPCPVCGSATVEHVDILDELCLRVIDEGGSVEHVVAETPLRERLVAAGLRFRPPPSPGEAG
jgi:peptide chain release factor subunit 1